MFEMLRKREPDALKKLLLSSRRQAEALHAAIEAQGDEPSDYQIAKLSALYMLIYDLENPDDSLPY